MQKKPNRKLHECHIKQFTLKNIYDKIDKISKIKLTKCLLKNVTRATLSNQSIYIKLFYCAHGQPSCQGFLYPLYKAMPYTFDTPFKVIFPPPI